jgi:flagellar basal-body rod protein FlgF
MENTLLVALSRQIALRRELDVVANNMANVNTHGFRREVVEFQEYMMPVASADGFPVPDRRMSYVQDRSTFHDLQAGALQVTGNPLDVAIEGGNAYFVVEGPGGEGERYTKNGAFQIDGQGRLVTSAGVAVLGASGPIVLDPEDTEIKIARDGTISTKEGVLGRMRLAAFDNERALLKEGDTTFRAAEGQEAQVPAPGSVRLAQGTVEGSNVKPVLEMARLIEINRAYSSLSALIQRNDDIRKSAVERLADIPS